MLGDERMEKKIPSVLDNPPSEETKQKMAEFFAKTSWPRIQKAYQEGLKSEEKEK